MFAIVSFSKQQFKVKAGDFIRVPRQMEEPESMINVPVLAFGEGESFAFDEPQLKKAYAKAVVLRHLRGSKILVFKKKRRKGYRRTKGHRQELTEVCIVELGSPNGEVAKADPPKKARSQEKSAQSSTEKVAGAQAEQAKVREPKAQSAFEKPAEKPQAGVLQTADPTEKLALAEQAEKNATAQTAKAETKQTEPKTKAEQAEAPKPN